MRWLLPAALSGLLVWLSWKPPGGFLGWWLDVFWPAWQRSVLAFQEVAAFPLAAVMLPLMIVAVVIVPVWAWVRTKRFREFFFAFMTAAAVSGLLLQLGWGLNYNRPGVARQLQLSRGGTLAERRELAGYLLAVLQGSPDRPGNPAGALSAARAELGELLGPLGYRVLPGPLPYRVPSGSFLFFGVAGSVFPPTVEAFTDAAMPEWQQVAVGIHELAHVAGVAREDDATLLGALAGLRSSHPYARYALALHTLAGIELPLPERLELLQQLPPRAADDLSNALRVASYYESPAFSALQQRSLDAWLRFNRRPGGTGDYSLGASRLPLALASGLLPPP